MPTVRTKTLQDMIGAIPDPKQRKLLSNIVSGKITYEVRCESKVCEGAVVGHIYADGTVMEKENEEKTSGLISWRKRFDGELGFRCLCGNESIQAKEEKGHLPIRGTGIPSRSDLEQISQKLAKRSKGYEDKPDGRLVDGFKLVRA